MRKSEVCLIIGLCLVVLGVFPPRAQGRSQGVLTACRSNLKNIGTAMEMYASDNAGAYPESMARLTPNYLKQIPNCPAAGRDTYSSAYYVNSNPHLFAVFCSGSHPKTNTPAHFPAYDSVHGLVVGPAQTVTFYECQERLKSAQKEVEKYSKEHHQPPLALNLTANCPSGDRFHYVLGSDKQSYKIFCGSLTGHLNEDVQPFNPSFDSVSATTECLRISNVSLPPQQVQLHQGRSLWIVGSCFVVVMIVSFLSLARRFPTS